MQNDTAPASILLDSESGAILTSSFEAAMYAGHAVNLAPNTALVARNGDRYLIADSAAPILDDENRAPSGIRFTAQSKKG